VTIKEGLDTHFDDRADVFVAGDLLWYPVEGDPKIRVAPDTMVAFGRPKGYRGSYLQWMEEGIAPQVVFEVLSPGNRPAEMLEKFRFYERHGVEEYYVYDPDKIVLSGWIRQNGSLEEIPNVDGWISPRLQVQFRVTPQELILTGRDGRRFLSYGELYRQRDKVEKERDQVVLERDQAALARDQVAQERDQAAREREQLARTNERLLAQLRALGIEPELE
jgi:Uma2 family endonuclease